MSPSEPRHGTYSLADMIRVMDLEWGAERARSISSIAERRNVSRREAEAACQELALTGYVPLVAGPNGVYLESDPVAVERYAERLEQRLRSQVARIKALRTCAEAMRPKEQQTLGLAA